MDVWQIGLLAVAAYIAVLALVRLMRARRDFFMAELALRIQEEQYRRHAEEQSASADEDE